MKMVEKFSPVVSKGIEVSPLLHQVIMVPTTWEAVCHMG